MSATADEQFDERFRELNARLGAVLDSAEECVRALQLATPEPAPGPGAVFPDAAALVDGRGHLDLAAVDVDVGWRLPQDLCRSLRILPVRRHDDDVLTVAVESRNVGLARKLLERHPGRRDAEGFEFVVISRADMNAAIELVHGRPPLYAVAPPAAEPDAAAAPPECPPPEPTAGTEQTELPDTPATTPEGTSAAEIGALEELWAAAAVAPRTLPRRPIGAHLVDRGAVTPAQVDEALALQQRYGDRIGELLVHELGAEEDGRRVGARASNWTSSSWHRSSPARTSSGLSTSR